MIRTILFRGKFRPNKLGLLEAINIENLVIVARVRLNVYLDLETGTVSGFPDVYIA